MGPWATVANAVAMDSTGCKVRDRQTNPVARHPGPPAGLVAARGLLNPDTQPCVARREDEWLRGLAGELPGRDVAAQSTRNFGGERGCPRREWRGAGRAERRRSGLAQHG